MGTYEELKAAIQQVIRTNGNNEITGALLQNALLSIVNVVGANATFAGIATPNTNPGTADQNVFYLATEAGTYVNFGGIEINMGEAVILSNKTGNWVKTTSGFVTQQKLTELESKLGQELNLLGLPYYYINGFINVGGGISLTPDNDQYRLLICPIDEDKKYKYYSAIFSQAGDGGACGIYDESFQKLWSYNITFAQWIDIDEIPNGAKYFIAAIKFGASWTDAQMNDCCFIEKNKWFTYLEELALVLKTDLATTAKSISSPSALKSKISQSLYELSYSYINKIGVVGRYYNGFVATGGSYSFLDNSGYKTIVVKVEPKVRYKLFISGANNAAYNCGDYAFHSGDALDSTTKILTSEGNPKDTWLSLTAPDNAKYLIVCVEFNNSGDYKQSCVIEENVWVKKIDDFVDNTENVFNYNSKNLFNETYDKGFISISGVFSPTPDYGDRYLTTSLIEIEPNTFYYLTGRDGAFNCAAYKEDGTTPLPLLRTDGTAATGSDIYYLFGTGAEASTRLSNGPFLTPENAKYVRFTIRFDNLPENYLFRIMLQKIGRFYSSDFVPASYQGYKLEGRIKNDALPLVNSILRGKKIAYNGDSFCESRFTGFAKNGGAYAYLISQAVGGTYDNIAVSGKCLSAVDGSGGIVNEVSNMPDDADLICFEGGINDWGLNRPLGTLTEGDFSGEYDINTITGALETIFYTAINKWVGKPICFVIFHKVDTAMVTAMAGTCYSVHDRLVDVCKKWSIPYYDAFEKSGLNGAIPVQNNSFLNGGSNRHPDGWHPDVEGYRRYYVPQLIKLFESLIMVNY